MLYFLYKYDKQRKANSITILDAGAYNYDNFEKGEITVMITVKQKREIFLRIKNILENRQKLNYSQLASRC